MLHIKVLIQFTLLLCLPQGGCQPGYLPAAECSNVVTIEGVEVTEVLLGCAGLVGSEVEQLGKTGYRYYTPIMIKQPHPWVE